MREGIKKIMEEILVARSEINAQNLNEFIDEIVDEIQELDPVIGALTRELVCVVSADFYIESKDEKDGDGDVEKLARAYIASLREEDGMTSIIRRIKSRKQ